jgi:ATP-binding cassette subfamily C protein
VVAAPRASLAAAALAAGLLALPMYLTRTAFQRAGEQELRGEELSLRIAQQCLQAPRELRLFQRAPFFVTRYLWARTAQLRARLERQARSDVMRYATEAMFVLGVLAVAAVTLATGAPGPQLSVLGLFAYAAFRLLPSTNRIVMHANSLRAALPAVRELNTELAELALPADDAPAATAPVPLREAIGFDDVLFRYPGAARDALQGVTLTIARGESLAIVGATGAGKTTLVDLLLGLQTPTAGRLRIDGRDLAELRCGWQATVAYVSQQFVVFDGSLRENIAFGEEPGRADEARLQQALQAAGLAAVVAALPQGLDSALGEGGQRLSGGERQRVAIARALYRQPSVLVLDEASSALDAVTERAVADAIDRLPGERTLLVIAHRAETVARCRRVVMLREGRVVAQGRHDELLRDDAGYRALMATPAPREDGSAAE